MILTNVHVEMEDAIRRVIIHWEVTFAHAGKGTELLLINTHVKVGLFSVLNASTLIIRRTI